MVNLTPRKTMASTPKSDAFSNLRPLFPSVGNWSWLFALPPPTENKTPVVFLHYLQASHILPTGLIQLPTPGHQIIQAWYRFDKRQSEIT